MPAPVKFFSVLNELARSARQSMPLEQWRRYLEPGRVLRRGDVSFPLKKDELLYGGAEDLIGSGGRFEDRGVSISPTELADELEAHQREHPPLDFETLSTPIRHESFGNLAQHLPFQRRLAEPLTDAENAEYARLLQKPRLEMTDADSERMVELHRRNNESSPDDAVLPGAMRYADQYQLPGERLGQAEEMSLLPGVPFVAGSHFNSQPGLISWSRLTRRPVLDDNGGTATHLEEIQSDWHQKGRDEGYADGPSSEVETLKKKLDDERGVIIDGLRNEDNLGFDTPTEAYQAVVSLAEDPASWEMSPELFQRIIQQRQLRAQYRKARDKPGVPRAPFADDRYLDLELRKAIARAVENDDDYVTWTTGKQQAERWNNNPEFQEGMVQYYDRKLPSVAKKLAQQYGLGPDAVTQVKLPAPAKPNPELYGELEGFYRDFRDPHGTFVDDDAETMFDQADSLTRRILGLDPNTDNVDLDEGPLVEELFDVRNTWDNYVDQRAGWSKAAEALRDWNSKLYGSEDSVARAELHRQREAVGSAVLNARKAMDEAASQFSGAVKMFQLAGRKILTDSAPSHQPVHALRLTPEARDKIRRIGLPLFSAAPLLLAQPDQDLPPGAPRMAAGGTPGDYFSLPVPEVMRQFGLADAPPAQVLPWPENLPDLSPHFLSPPVTQAPAEEDQMPPRDPNEPIPGAPPPPTPEATPAAAPPVTPGPVSVTPTPALVPTVTTQELPPEPAYLRQLALRESGANPRARAGTSSATGLFQFIDSTWKDLMRRHPELKLTADGRLDVDQQKRAVVAFTRDNAGYLERQGIIPTDLNLYVAHFLGPVGASSFLRAAEQHPGAPATRYVPPSVSRANRPVFFRSDGSPRTVMEAVQWLGRGFSGNTFRDAFIAPSKEIT